MGMVDGGDFEGRNGRMLVSIAMLPGNGRLSKAYPFYLWLLCVGVSIHISFCGMTYHVITSHESNALLTSLTLWILKFAFNTTNLLLSIMLGLTAISKIVTPLFLII